METHRGREARRQRGKEANRQEGIGAWLDLSLEPHELTSPAASFQPLWILDGSIEIVSGLVEFVFAALRNFLRFR